MTFWIGVSLGFGAGSCGVFLVMVFLLSRIFDEKASTSESLHAYWKFSQAKQAEQVLVLSDIAKSLKKHEEQGTDA